MSSTFKFHSQVGEVVPWQANYTFPTQSTQVSKSTVKLPAKTGFTYKENTTARIEFPSDNYLNVLNSVLLFDITTGGGTRMFQRGGAHNAIKRLRIMYGSLVIEDIQDYKTLVRIMTEAGVQQDYATSSGSILDGMYDTFELAPGAGSLSAYTAGVTNATITTTELGRFIQTPSTAAVALSATKRTYALNLMSGILTAEKLIPLKWMAAQLSIEVTFAGYNEAFIAGATNQDSSAYVIDNVQFLAEMVTFSDTYDAAFVAGLEVGVPIKFSSWHLHSFNVSGSSATLQIHERSRSVKAGFAVMKNSGTDSVMVDSDIFFHDAGSLVDTTTGVFTAGSSPIKAYQWRVGGTYYPSQPVSCEYGAAEAYVELMKTLNTLGDFTRASNINYTNWSGAAGQKFIMACEFENTDVMPQTIAGINAEEQSDIALRVEMAGVATSKKIDVFMHYDALLIVRKNNYVDIVM